MPRYKFTVFTPAYNRAHTLGKVFACLQAQTLRDFEWIVVDDGSTDGTDALLRQLLPQADFSVKHIALPQNSGKHIAQNRALEQAEGTFFSILDSDDTLVPEALETLWRDWCSLSPQEQRDCSGICCLCKTPDGKIVGRAFPQDHFVVTDLELHFKYKLSGYVSAGEKWGFYRTELLRQFPNPEVKGHFFYEDAIWFQVSQHHPKVCFNQALRLYEPHADSVSTQHQSSAAQRDYHYNIESNYLSACMLISQWFPWFVRYDPVHVFKYPLKAGLLQTIQGRPVYFGPNATLRQLKPLPAKLVLLCAAPALALYRLTHSTQSR